MQIEDRFVQQQHEIASEIQQIRLVKKVLDLAGRPSLLKPVLCAVGLQIVHFGMWLVKKTASTRSVPKNTPRLPALPET
ncbi:MAG: hypothetical protein ACK2T7_03735 [Anaerolineales bacterium]